METENIIEADICIIGAGSGGLSVAAGAAQLGVKTVLVEKAEMGGDCLNTGCVPSKSLLAAAKAAAGRTHGDALGIAPAKPKISFAKVNDHIKDVIAGIAPHDSVERFEGLGATVLRGKAVFVEKNAVDVDGTTVRAKYFVIATGSRAALPPIEGLKAVDGVLTNENIFTLRKAPKHLVIIGGGPIGMEMAQAHRRLGADVTVLEASTILPKDDPALVDVIRTQLRGEGVIIRENVSVTHVADTDDGGVRVDFDFDGTAEHVTGSHLLVAAGRSPNVDGLGLDKAGVDFDERGGIAVDKRLRTSNKRIFAIGDCAGGPQFTHVAGYQAGIVIRNALFKIPARVDYASLPWVTYTDPELANAGLSESMARQKYGNVETLTWEYAENDRARAERKTDGLIKVVVKPNGKILGAGIAGHMAGELIQPWILAIAKGMKIADMAGTIAPYPTYGEISKRAAGSFYTPKLFSTRTRKVVAFLMRIFG